MALSIDKRGIYGQAESDKAASNAAAERLADSDADRLPGSSSDYVRQMAEFRQSGVGHAKAETRLIRRGAMSGAMVARVGQRAALQGVANLAEDMRRDGFAFENVMGAINQSEGLAAHLSRVERCTQIAPAVQPEVSVENGGKARVRGQCALINNAARNGLLDDKYRGLKPRPSAKAPIIPVADRDCGKDDGDGDTSKRYIV